MIPILSASLLFVPLALAEAPAPMVRALSAYEAPACQDIAALSPSPVEDLGWVVDHVSQPPWAPMTAAQCLLQLYPEETRPVAERWVVDPERAGLARLVFGELERLPPEVALPLARAALAGPHAPILERRLARSEDPTLRALVLPAP
ncbi:MAG: hypothetical protein H6739_01495 [Alphaproteobacteria bacterium]|nr:hypothetical protein [Alphaproteobacteria bacterium]